jgi:uncharacterized membrane protein
MQKLSWREIYAGVLILIIGIVYLLMQVASLMSNQAHAYSVQNGAFLIDKNQFLSDLKTYSVILAAIVAGWLLLKGKRFGWMLGVPLLLFAIALVFLSTVEPILKTKKFAAGNALITPGVTIFLLLLAMIFLLLPSARQKYRVNKGIALLTLLLFAGLGCSYFFLQ